MDTQATDAPAPRILYTAEATVTGGRVNGHGRSSSRRPAAPAIPIGGIVDSCQAIQKTSRRSRRGCVA